MPDDGASAWVRRPTGVFTGLAVLDAIYRVPQAPGPNQKIRAQAPELAAGGPAANAAVTFAALGGRPHLVTALGAHPFARVVADDLRDHGVDVVDACPGRAEPPALASVYVTAGGDRSVVSAGDLGEVASPPGELAGLVAGADVVLLDGHHPGLARATVAATASAVPVILDGGSWKPVLADLLPRVEIAACSADFRVPGAEAGQVPFELFARGARAVNVTRGAAPVLWWRGDDHGEVAVPVVAAADTLGAGDVFHGALAFARAARSDLPLPWQISFANAIAALRCGHEGTRSWLADPRIPGAIAALQAVSGSGPAPLTWARP